MDSIETSFSELLKFILLQDPVKIAIGLALGMAFSKVCLSIISDFIKPIINFMSSKINLNLNYSEFKFGDIIEQIITFFIFITILYFFIIVPLENLKKKYNVGIKNAQCPYCFTLINPLSTKCSSCTSSLNSDWSKNNEN